MRHHAVRGQLVPGEPGRAIGRAVRFVAQRAADHRHPVEERDRLHLPRPPVREPSREDPRADRGDPLDPAHEPGLLLELAHDGGLGAFPEVDAAAGERPRPG